MKIVYCTDNICYPGGIQRITIAKANALAEMDGNEVWIAVTDNKRPTPVLPVSERVHIVDLDVNYYADDWKSRLHVLKGIFIKRREHRRKLKQLLEDIRPDIVISTGTAEKNFLPKLQTASGPSFIREIHFPSNYRRLAANGWFEKLSAWVGDFFDYKISIRRYDRIVVLTHEDKERHWSRNDNVTVIPNPLTIQHCKRSALTNKTVITAGRLVAVKNFSSLIRAWAIVHRSFPDWRLEIWGEGNLRSELQAQIDALQLSDSIGLMGYTDSIISKFADASVFVCTSLFEGFPLVLLEAMSCGLPVVSYDCPYGQKDMIAEGQEGFLTAVGDEPALARHISHLIADEAHREMMGQAALKKSQHYSMSRVMSMWTQLFTGLTN